jgi:hypothetical protein
MSREVVVMRRIIGVVVMALVMIAGLSVFSASAGGDGSSHDGGGLRLLSRTVDSADLDLGAAGPSLGDQFVFTDKLLMKGKVVGSDHGFCTLLRLEGNEATVQCVVTLVLNGKGQITVQGVAVFSENENPTFTLAITGGTDRFRNASGQLKVREVSDTDSVLRVQLGND